MERKIELKLREFNVKRVSNMTLTGGDGNVKELYLNVDDLSIALDFCICEKLDKMFSDLWITECPIYPNSSRFGWVTYCPHLNRNIAITVFASVYSSHRFSIDFEHETIYRLEVMVDTQDAILLAVCNIVDDAFQALINLMEEYYNSEEFISFPPQSIG